MLLEKNMSSLMVIKPKYIVYDEKIVDDFCFKDFIRKELSFNSIFNNKTGLIAYCGDALLIRAENEAKQEEFKNDLGKGYLNYVKDLACSDGSYAPGLVTGESFSEYNNSIWKGLQKGFFLRNNKEDNDFLKKEFLSNDYSAVSVYEKKSPVHEIFEIYTNYLRMKKLLLKVT